MDNERLLDQVPIYSISWDSGDRSITYFKGQHVRLGKSSEKYPIILISRNEEHYHMFDDLAYFIYIELNGESKLWRAVHGKAMDIVFEV